MVKFENVQIQLVDLPPITLESQEGWLYGIIRTGDAALLVIDLASEDLISQTETVLRLLDEAGIRLVQTPQKANQKPAVVVANKLDAPGAAARLQLLREFVDDRLAIIPVSAAAGTGLEGLRQTMFDLLRIIRVYSKPPGKKADLATPFILKRGATVLDAAEAIHRAFVERLKFARLWSGQHYQGQMVGRDHVLQDGDIIEVHA